MKMDPFLSNEPFCFYGCRFGEKLKLSLKSPHEKENWILAQFFFSVHVLNSKNTPVKVKIGDFIKSHRLSKPMPGAYLTSKHVWKLEWIRVHTCYLEYNEKWNSSMKLPYMLFHKLLVFYYTNLLEKCAFSFECVVFRVLCQK